MPGVCVVDDRTVVRRGGLHPADGEHHRPDPLAIGTNRRTEAAADAVRRGERRHRDR